MRYVYLKFDFKQSAIISLFLMLLYIFLKDTILLNKDLFFVKLSFIFLLQLFSAIILIFFCKLEYLSNFWIFKKLSGIVSKQTYSVYLTHMIFIYFLKDQNINSFTKFMIYLSLLIAISTLSYYFIEKPILKTRPKYS